MIQNPFFRIFILILLIFILLIMITYGFNYFGVFDAREVYYSLFKRFPGIEKFVYKRNEDISALQSAELDKKFTSLNDKLVLLKKEQAKLTNKIVSLREKEINIEQQQKDLSKEKQRFELEKARYNDYQKNIEEIAVKISQMPPTAARDRLLRMEDLLIIDILRKMDEIAAAEGKQTITTYLLQIMPQDRASAIMRKMTEVKRK